ncbi:MAG: hypothetical protein ACLPN1_03795 [Dissulfurispiraceae bacterium]|jgi:hypothetical protein
MSYRSILLIIFLLAVCPAFAWGDEFRIVPSLSVKEEYNSNIFFSTNDKKDDFTTTLSPGFEMVNNTELLNMDVLARLDRLEYVNNKDLDATDQTLNGSLRYSFTPLLSVSAAGGYVKDSRPDRYIETTGIVLSSAPGEHPNASLSANYQFTEKTLGSISYAYLRDHFVGQSYLDDISHDVNAGLVYDLGTYFPAVKGRINTEYNYYSFPGSHIGSVMGTVGFSRDFSEVWSIQIDGGAQHTQSDIAVSQLEPVFVLFPGFPPIQIGNQLVSEQVKNTGWGWVGRASLNFKGEVGTGSLSYSRNVQPAVGLGGAAVRDSIVFSGQHRLSYEWLLLFNAGYFTNNSNSQEFSSQTINQRSFDINTVLRYEFSRNVYVEGSLDYVMFDDLVARTNINRYLCSLRLYIQHPVLE